MIKEFKIRASACSNIMGKKGLGKTGETYCKDWLKGQIYKRDRIVNTKYMQKGNEVEDNSIDFICEQLGLGFVMKNEKFFQNDFMQGTPDIITKDLIIDVKNSWDIHTFPLFDDELPNDAYYWQSQVYMDLVGIENYKVVYCLTNTPMHMIEREAFYYCKNNGYDELEPEILKDFIYRMTYDDVPNDLKFKVYDIKRNQTDIDLIKERVNDCKNFISLIKK